MSYPSGNQGYYSAGQSGGYGAYSPRPSGRGGNSESLPGYLAIVVVLLGLASYLVSYGPVFEVGGDGWAVRFAVLAALLAAFGLAPRQTPRPKVIAVLATTGFLDALSSRITAPEGSHPGWALTVIVVLNGLQAAAAIGALLVGGDSRGDRTGRSDYDAYADYYARAAQYYGQYSQQQAKPDTLQRAATAQAQAQQQVAAQRSQQAAASQAGNYADYVGSHGAEQTSGHSPTHPEQQAAPAGPQAGLPNFGPAQTSVQQPGGYAESEHRPTSQQ